MPTSPTTDPRAGGDAGFTLIEATLALALIALIAALALPFVRPAGGTADLRARAYQVAALLRTDRAAAQRAGKTVETAFDPRGPVLRSGATGETVDLSRGIAVRVSGWTGGRVAFHPDGRSSGGAVALATRATRIDVAVDGFTSAVTIRPGADAP
ncbi:prepilin-type N-terminal cleavage/methylation domain-containing protein [Methylopila henanensis]|uniref:Prepilin-type N-terminal cleavage/methylation domain-containing protein n=1 Tax=Methylopila henanensis TaxID=873516 RepID=A0ABW4K6S6_9HYPH